MRKGQLAARRLGSSVRASTPMLVVGAGSILGAAGMAHGAAIDVLMSRTTFVSATGNSTNNGIVPQTYTPATVNIADVAGQTYDAADVADSGTTWNALQCPSGSSVANSSGGSLTTLYEQNIPLVNSTGGSTSVQLSVSFTENNGKTDEINQSGTTAGTDGTATPSGLMGQYWFDNGTSEYLTYTLTGLTANAPYLLYLYSGTGTLGQGATFALAAANQPAGYAAVSTQPSSSSSYVSVFDSTGINPIPKESLSWNELSAVADPSGDLTFLVNKDATTGIKGAINGFQLDTPVPEPMSVAVFAVGGAGLLVRRRRC